MRLQTRKKGSRSGPHRVEEEQRRREALGREVLERLPVVVERGREPPEVVRDAHLKSVFQISTEAKALGKRAKEKKLAPADYTGGTFCVSNLGMMGIPKFTAIINPPNSAILAVGTTVTKPVVKNGQIVVGQTMTVTLSADHRAFDGAVAAQYLGALKQILELPALLLV